MPDIDINHLARLAQLALDPADVSYMEEAYQPVENLLSLGTS